MTSTRLTERLSPLSRPSSTSLESRLPSLQSSGILPGLANSLARSHKLSSSSPSTIPPRSAGSGKLNLSKAAIAAGDWFSRNLRDSGIADLTRSLTRDGQLNRKDMLAILRTSRDGGLVSAGELKDLRFIVSNTSRFTIKNYIRVLTNKVVNSNVANQNYQGSRLGNLSAGGRSTHLDKLIGKWFLGKDRPTTTSPSYTYTSASGSLFQNGISYKDVKQGLVGDCYFLASLGAVARRSASTIQNMFTDNGDNTYTVRFYKNGVADYVTVDKYLPTDASKRFVYANYGNVSSSSKNELWVALAEKAYAQLNQSGWIGQNNTNSYKGIEGGLGYYAMPHITGRDTTYAYTPSGLSSTNFTAMVKALKAGQLVTVGTKAVSSATNLVPSHEYTVVDYNASTRKLTLFNPWGTSGGYYNGRLRPGTVEINTSSLLANFDYWARTT